jgi:hypothetical protein
VATGAMLLWHGQADMLSATAPTLNSTISLHFVISRHLAFPDPARQSSVWILRRVLEDKTSAHLIV